MNSIQAYKKQFSVESFYKMWKAGIFDSKERIELIQGAFYQKSPKTPLFCHCIRKLSEFFIVRYQSRFQTRIYNPLRFDDYTELVPDIALVEPKGNYYQDAYPTPKEVLLLIEVVNSSHQSDRNIKLPLYAKAGIPEVWIVNLEAKSIEVYTKPDSGAYTQQQGFAIGDTINSDFIKEFEVSYLFD